MIRFSLLVPCYNSAPYIDVFLHNLAKLSIPFDEVIFYDDASTDSSTQILRNRGQNVIQSEVNRGPGYARNQLALKATGDYIHFHDIDDEFNPLFLVLINEQLKLKQADVIIGEADWIAAGTRQSIIRWRYNQKELKKKPLAYFMENPLGVINTLYSKKIFLSINGFNEDIKCWEDTDLHIRLAAANASFSVINQVLAYSLRHNQGISHNQIWCWSCRLKFLRIYLNEYLTILGPEVFRVELKKVQTNFILSGQYNQLVDILLLNNYYRLGMDTKWMVIIHQLNKVLPSGLIKRFIKLSLFLKHFINKNW